MSDIKLFWDNRSATADIAIVNGDIVMDDGMETAVILSLFTDRRAPADAAIPDGTEDRRGWWGDGFQDVDGDEDGSLLWLLDRSKIMPETLALLKDYSQQALAWMIKDGVAKSIDITVVRTDISSAGIGIAINKPDGTTTRYDYIWDSLK